MKPSVTCILLTFLTALLSFSVLHAQIEYEGQPYGWDEADRTAPSVMWYATEALDRELIEAQDAVTDPMKDVPYRFGWEWDVSLDLTTAGEWTDLPNGDRLWHLGIDCPDARSVSFIFDRYVLPKGAKLFIYDEDRTHYRGAFTHKNNKEWGSLAVGLTYGDKVILELYEPAIVQGQTELSVETIVHGYRSILRAEEIEKAQRGPFGNSGACNINVNCPIADEWQIEKRSVALIVSGGFAQCSGALVNNTQQDGTPYFLTANHCLGQPNNWVFYFNHESATCSGSNGPTNQSVSGSTLRANRAASDFALLELSSIPPANFNVQYAGWDNSDAQTVTSGVGIHHPSGDVKKICFEDDAPYHQNVFGAACWYINQWEDGVTEGGSSGSPLFDQNHRVIGQLYGGGAACSGQVNNGQPDWYGRFGVSWNGNSSSQRLRDWLDPGNTGIAVLDGYPDGFVAAEYDAAAGQISNVSSTVCGNSVTPAISISNNGSVTLTSLTVTATLNGTQVANVPWTGSLAQNESTVVNLPAITISQANNNNLVIEVSAPNGQQDENMGNNSTSVSFNAVLGETYEFTFNLILDDYGSETTWQIANNSGQTFFSGGPYPDGEDGTLVSETFCLPDGCYTFTIFDDWGDGICCGYGQGSWEIVNWNNVTIGSGGEFDDVETYTFCIDEVSVNELANDPQLHMFPNPAGQAVTIDLPEGARELVIFNAMGQRVFNTSANGSERLVVDVANWAVGRYHVQLIGEHFMRSEALLIAR